MTMHRIARDQFFLIELFLKHFGEFAEANPLNTKCVTCRVFLFLIWDRVRDSFIRLINVCSHLELKVLRNIGQSRIVRVCVCVSIRNVVMVFAFWLTLKAVLNKGSYFEISTNALSLLYSLQYAYHTQNTHRNRREIYSLVSVRKVFRNMVFTVVHWSDTIISKTKHLAPVTCFKFTLENVHRLICAYISMCECVVVMVMCCMYTQSTYKIHRKCNVHSHSISFCFEKTAFSQLQNDHCLFK